MDCGPRESFARRLTADSPAPAATMSSAKQPRRLTAKLPAPDPNEPGPQLTLAGVPYIADTRRPASPGARMLAVQARRDLTHREKTVLSVIAYYDMPGDDAHLKRRSLAEKCGMGLSALDTTLAALSKKGAVRRRRTGRAARYALTESHPSRESESHPSRESESHPSRESESHPSRESHLKKGPSKGLPGGSEGAREEKDMKATEGQLVFLEKLCRERGVERPPDLDGFTRERASAEIDRIKAGPRWFDRDRPADPPRPPDPNRRHTEEKARMAKVENLMGQYQAKRREEGLPEWGYPPPTEAEMREYIR